ncbi:hypothetical protein RUM43_000353 [Polyplax serrata]|uniref:Oxoglutarate/iron-dependent oxygenase C-terminal degradation domain-containing protein n=1 Tax=Polyplax serrata TaxID=468196 RepID=A0AAN8SCP2_POLSC
MVALRCFRKNGKLTKPERIQNCQLKAIRASPRLTLIVEGRCPRPGSSKGNERTCQVAVNSRLFAVICNYKNEALDVVLRLPFTDAQVKHTEEDESNPAGQVIYLDGESKDEECLLHLGDKMNCLALVFRDAKTLRFTKYLPAGAEPFFQIFCTYYQRRPSVDQPDLRHCAEESDFSEGSDDVLSDSE